MKLCLSKRAAKILGDIVLDNGENFGKKTFEHAKDTTECLFGKNWFVVTEGVIPRKLSEYPDNTRNNTRNKPRSPVSKSRPVYFARRAERR